MPWWKWFTAVSSGPSVACTKVRQSHHKEHDTFFLYFYLGMCFIHIQNAICTQFILNMNYKASYSVFNNLNFCGVSIRDSRLCSITPLWKRQRHWLSRHSNCHTQSLFCLSKVIYYLYSLQPGICETLWIIWWVVAQRLDDTGTQFPANRLRKPERHCCAHGLCNHVTKSVQPFVKVSTKNTVVLLNLFHYREI